MFTTDQLVRQLDTAERILLMCRKDQAQRLGKYSHRVYVMVRRAEERVEYLRTEIERRTECAE